MAKKDAKSEKKKRIFIYPEPKNNFHTINIVTDKNLKKIKIATSFRSASLENQIQDISNKLSYNKFRTIKNYNNNFLVGLRNNYKNKSNIQSEIGNPKSSFNNYMNNNVSRKSAFNFSERTNTSELNKYKVNKNNSSCNKLKHSSTNKSTSKKNLKTIS